MPTGTYQVDLCRSSVIVWIGESEPETTMWIHVEANVFMRF